MFTIFFLSSFCQLLSPRFQARIGRVRPGHESSDQPAQKSALSSVVSLLQTDVETEDACRRKNNWKNNKTSLKKATNCQNMTSYRIFRASHIYTSKGLVTWVYIVWGLGGFVLACCTIKGMLFATLNKHSIVSKVNLQSDRCILIMFIFDAILSSSISPVLVTQVWLV